MVFRRILLKVSGEALGGDAGAGFDGSALEQLTAEIKSVSEAQVEVALVIGAGNLVRGRRLQSELNAQGLRQVTADQMGMLGTIANGLALRDLLNHADIPTAIYATHGIPSIVAPYAVTDAREAMHDGKVVICTGGTGNPLFTTDSAACLRGIELEVDVVIKATQVDGVYDGDPHKDPNAKRYESLTFDEAITQRLEVIDTAASALCRENDMPLIVYAFKNEGALSRIVSGSNEGTIIRAS